MAIQPEQQSSTSPTKISLKNDSPKHCLAKLQALSASERAAIRTLSITQTETQCLAWHGRLSPGVRDVFDDDDLAEYARIHHWPSAAGPDPKVNSAVELREGLRFVAENFDLPNLSLEVDPGSAAWSLFQDKAAGGYEEDVEKNWRFVYEFYLEVGRALLDTFGGKELAGLSISTNKSIPEFAGMGAWLEREVTGKEGSSGKMGKVPAYHDVAKRL